MNKRIIITLISLCGLALSATAQETTSPQSDEIVSSAKDRRKSQQEITDFVPQSIFVEVLGPSLTMGVNYERRFSKQLNGLGGRVGLSLFSNPIGSGTLLSLPVGFNYLLGSSGKYFEMGVSGTLSMTFLEPDEYLYPPIGQDSSLSRGRQSSIESDFHMNLLFGYRSQPINGGYMFRIGVAPMISFVEGSIKYMPFFPYLSFGYIF